MTTPAPDPTNPDLFSFIVRDDWTVSLNLALLPVLIAAVLCAIVLIVWRIYSGRRFGDFEIDSAELGFGDQKLSFKPNDLDRQIAYSIWVELSTRKIGLPIDPDHDVMRKFMILGIVFLA